MSVQLRWGDIRGLERFSKAIRDLGNDESRKVLNRAINRTGDMARTKVVRGLAKQTGLSRWVTVRAVRNKRSSWEDLSYTMEGSGGDISLKYFKPDETDEGVSAAPFGRRTVFEGAFLRGGAWPNKRGELLAGGHAFFRTGPKRLPIERSKSGVVIPVEMVKGETATAFEATVADVLPRRVEHEIRRASKGVIT